MKYGCCIVETRPIENLQSIIQDKHLKFVPKDWGLTLYLSNANVHLITPELFGRDFEVRILHANFGIIQYNRLLTSVDFWRKLPYEEVLIFQSDSELFREGIMDFVGDWAFIGAPDERKGCEGMMNGGLSLRNVKDCLELCDKREYHGSMNEDWWFCKHLPQGLLPDKETATMFSIETKYYPHSLGAHAIDKYLSENECKILREYTFA